MTMTTTTNDLDAKKAVDTLITLSMNVALNPCAEDLLALYNLRDTLISIVTTLQGKQRVRELGDD